MRNILIGLFAGVVGFGFVRPISAVEAPKAKEKVLYSFDGTNGYEPTASLIDVRGTLYGTTYWGGTSTGCNNLGCGTVFSLDPKTGVETVLYSFCSQENCTDGQGPIGGLAYVNGTLYGTTYVGGTNNGGTLYWLDLQTGVETVIYSFCTLQNCTDGAGPDGGIIDVSGALYGTTLAGGNAGCGGFGCGTV